MPLSSLEAVVSFSHTVPLAETSALWAFEVTVVCDLFWLHPPPSSVSLVLPAVNSHSPQTAVQGQSPVRSECLCENSEKTRPHFLQNTEWFLECVSMSLPGVVDTSEFIPDYSFTTTGYCYVFICLY